MSNQRQIDDWIKGYLEYTSSTEAPEIFRRWTAISAVAAAMERKCWLEIGHEVFYPNLFIILVGPSGSRKGTAMKPVKDILDQIGVIIAPETSTKEALAEMLAESYKLEDDSQSEGKIDMIQHSSLTIYNEELAVLFKHNDPDLIMWLTNWHDCSPKWKRKTKTQGTSQVEGVWVNLLGAMTPELVKAYMPETALGGGLTGRIVFVFSARKGQVNPLPYMSEEHQALRKKLIHDLEVIHAMKGEFRLDPDTFIDPWIDWVVEQEQKEIFQEPNLDPYVNRRRAHLLKLCMILTASEGKEKILTGETFERGREILVEAERDMPRVFSGVGASSSARLMSEIAEYLSTQREVTREELIQRFRKEIKNTQHIDDILEVLKESGHIGERADIEGGKQVYYVRSDTNLQHLNNGSQ